MLFFILAFRFPEVFDNLIEWWAGMLYVRKEVALCR